MAKDLIKPATLIDLQVIGSKDILDAFIASKRDQAEVDIEATGRDAQTVYIALGLYLKRHPILETIVRMRKDKVYLFKTPGSAENADTDSQPT